MDNQMMRTWAELMARFHYVDLIGGFPFGWIIALSAIADRPDQILC
jgi:hypothetical protein